MNAALELSMETNKKTACDVLQLSRASFYRFHTQAVEPVIDLTNRRSPPRWP